MCASKTKILFSGASGSIGSVVYNVMKNDLDFDLQTISRSRTSNVVFDLSKDDFGNILSPDVFIHFAAVTPDYKRGLDDSVRANITKMMDENVFHFCRALDIPVLYISGCSLYDRTGATYFLTEDTALASDFNSPYLEAKFAGDRLFSSYDKATILRLSCPILPVESGQGIIGKFIEQVQDNGQITLWGDGSREQDFIDCTSIADAVAKVVKSHVFGAYNIASGQPVTMKKLAEIIASVLGGSVSYVDHPEAQDRIVSRYSIEKAQRDLGWNPPGSVETVISSFVKRYI